MPAIEPPVEHLWAVVPAGGSGTRLWPLSRSAAPKFVHDLTGSGRSLIQDTVARLRPLVGDRLLVVTGDAHRDLVVQQLPDVPTHRVLGEPAPRDSMAAIGLAAAMLEREDPGSVMGSFPADHVIRDSGALERAVRLAATAARDDWLVTVGIEPTRPATGFGYIHQGAALRGHDGAFVVEEFVEKPSLPIAERYVDSGDYRWNAGMFVVRPTVLLELLAQNHPDLARSLRTVAADPTRLTEVWPTLTRISIDHAVAEPAAAAGRVAVVPADLGWDDIGDFASLDAATGALDAAGPQVVGDPDAVLAVEAGGIVIPRGDRLVAVLGLDDVVVVDTPDALLVTTRERAQDVKEIVERLREIGRDDLM